MKLCIAWDVSILLMTKIFLIDDSLQIVMIAKVRLDLELIPNTVVISALECTIIVFEARSARNQTNLQGSVVLDVRKLSINIDALHFWVQAKQSLFPLVLSHLLLCHIIFCLPKL